MADQTMLLYCVVASPECRRTLRRIGFGPEHVPDPDVRTAIGRLVVHGRDADLEFINERRRDLVESVWKWADVVRDEALEWHFREACASLGRRWVARCLEVLAERAMNCDGVEARRMAGAYIDAVAVPGLSGGTWERVVSLRMIDDWTFGDLWTFYWGA